jgi:hypothetical protein
MKLTKKITPAARTTGAPFLRHVVSVPEKFDETRHPFNIHAQKQIAELFQKDVRTINEHIMNVFSDGKTYQTAHYHLDAIISVGYPCRR